MIDQAMVAPYDGTVPFTVSGRPLGTVQGRARVSVTAAFMVGPFAGLGVVVWLALGHGLDLADILLAAAFYVITGPGVTVGFRLLTHRSFTAAPALRVALAIAGAMSFEGEAIGWVAIHRRHDAFTDRPGDPHSPYPYGSSLAGQLRGLAHAHRGWLRDDPTPPAPYAPDMLADPAMRAISAAVIRIFERLGWAAKVRWPTPAHLDSRRRDSRRDGIR